MIEPTTLDKLLIDFETALLQIRAMTTQSAEVLGTLMTQWRDLDVAALSDAKRERLRDVLSAAHAVRIEAATCSTQLRNISQVAEDVREQIAAVSRKASIAS